MERCDVWNELKNSEDVAANAKLMLKLGLAGTASL